MTFIKKTKNKGFIETKNMPASMMKITFPGGQKVEAHHNGLKILTDQTKQDGGEGKAPSPFDLFIASIGTCTGYYVLKFCEQRKIPTKDIKLYLHDEWNPLVRRITKIKITIDLPSTFPKKYIEAIIRVAEQCSVKRHLTAPPEITIETKTD